MFSKKTVCFITGASRGFGENIAFNFSSKFAAGSLFVLLARSELDLERVKKRLIDNAPQAKVVTHVFNQGTLDQQVFETVFSQTLKKAGSQKEEFEQVVLVNNAATLDPVSFTRNLPGVMELAEYMNINVSGVIALTSSFLKQFSASSNIKRVIINISSLAAIQPFKSWVLYCSGKAARDMMHKVIAAEETDSRVLSYAPGSLITDMFDVATSSEDEGVREWAINAKADNKLISCEVSVQKLISILEADLFENGAHVDFYER